MNFTYENQGTNTYLVYQVTPDDVIDSMSLGMLSNNKIDGLATTLFMQVDMTKYIKYNVSAKVSVKQFFSGPVNKKRLVGVFSGIVNAMLSAEDYMIDTNTILLDMDYIFADVSTCETVLICVPVMGVNEGVPDIGAFFKNIVFSTQFDQTENCDYVAKIINYLNSTPVFSLSSFSEILKDIERGGVMKQAAPQPVQRPVQSVPKTTPRQVQRPVQQMQQPVQPVQKPVQQSVPQQVQKPVQQQPQQQSGFKIPGKEVPSQPVQQSVEQAGNAEKKMSMFYLLQHYSKENAAVYKAQKEADKGVKKSVEKEEKVKKNKKKGKETAPVNAAFQVPGAPVQQPKQGFSIPGQLAQPIQQPMQQASKMQNPVQQQVQQPVQQVSQQPTVSVSQVQANFGETTVLDGGGVGETTVLNMSMANALPCPHLVRVRNNERISLKKPVFRIGKEKSYVDYFISDNTAISRSHVNVITRDEEYFVVDTNSTNHTFVNGAMIQSNVEIKLFHGDSLRLANEDFEFKIY